MNPKLKAVMAIIALVMIAPAIAACVLQDSEVAGGGWALGMFITLIAVIFIDDMEV